MGRPLSARINTTEVVRLYRSGLTATAIAERMDTSQSVILRRLDRFGVMRKRRGKFSQNPIKPVVDAYASGLNVREVARKFGVSRTAVKWRLKRAGVQIRPAVARPPSGPASPCWRGGRANIKGYIGLRQVGGKYILEHRAVVQRTIGRELTKNEIIHHLNGIRDDNRPENLTVTTLKDHEHHTFVKRLQEHVRELEAIIKGQDRDYSERCQGST